MISSRLQRSFLAARKIRTSAEILAAKASAASAFHESSRDVREAAARATDSVKFLVGDFDEESYLHLNPDVAAALFPDPASAVFASGVASAREHWLKFGRAERRMGGPLEPLQNAAARASQLAQRPFGVNFYGYLESRSGLGQASRGFLRALEKSAIPANPINVPPWKPALELRSLPDFSPFRINLIQQNADVMVRFTKAYGTRVLSGCYNIAIWFWELPAMRSDWFQAYRYVDEIWVTSEFCRQSVQCLTSLPVRRMPLVVDNLEQRALFGREHFGLPNEVFVFSYVFDVSSQFERKNPLALVRAFRRAFGNSPEVLLCLKYSNSAFDQEAVRSLRAAAADASNIRTFESLFSDEEIASFHNITDCLVSPHRSEGFGFNLAEAMYLGKPVIATGYSSNLDFMSNENSYLIEHKLVPIRSQHGPYLKNAVWAEPSEEHLVHLLRRVFRNREEREAKASKAAQDIRRDFNSGRVSDVISARFREIGLDKLSPTLKLKEHRVLQRRFSVGGAPIEVTKAMSVWRRRPLVSFIMSVYNADHQALRRRIESLKAQWYPAWELCICDDASTDDRTLQVLEEYSGSDPRVKIIRSLEKRGAAAASNRAVEISMGELLAMLLSDDEVAPYAAYDIAAALNVDSDIELLYTTGGGIELSRGSWEPRIKYDWAAQNMQSAINLLHMLVIGKALFYGIGGFREELPRAQHPHLALRASAQARKVVSL